MKKKPRKEVCGECKHAKSSHKQLTHIEGLDRYTDEGLVCYTELRNFSTGSQYCWCENFRPKRRKK